MRTASRALARLAELAVEAAGDQPVDVCVPHLANAGRAEELAAALAERLADGLDGREVMCGELGAVLGAHVGPGMVAVCVAASLTDSDAALGLTRPVARIAVTSTAPSRGRARLPSVEACADPSPPPSTPRRCRGGWRR